MFSVLDSEGSVAALGHDSSEFESHLELGHFSELSDARFLSVSLFPVLSNSYMTCVKVSLNGLAKKKRCNNKSSFGDKSYSR